MQEENYYKKKNKILVEELLKSMPVQSDLDWGPNPIVCRWCGCWLEHGGVLKEQHDPNCFAVEHLGRCY